MTNHAIVIGAGFAGLSAAIRLAGHGARVLVIEEKPRLGGRATAFTDRETGERVDNGQHVLFGCYRETYAFLRAIGTAGLAPLQPRLSLLMAGEGRAFRLQCPSLRPPWHLLLGVLRWRALGWRDRQAVLALRRILLDVRRRGAAAVAADVPAEMTVSGWLAQQRQTTHLCRWLWDPLAIAALNQSPDTAAASPFVRVLGELFGPRVEDSAIGMPTVPLDELYAEPARRQIEQAGGRVLLRTRARVAVDTNGSLTVWFGSERTAVPVVISTVPWHEVRRLWDDVPASLAGVFACADQMVSSPIVTTNLWLDGALTGAPFVGLIDGPMHWAFDKAQLFGDAGAGHVSVVASGAVALAGLDNAAITDTALRQLRRALPGLHTGRLLRSVVVREPRATFSLAPGMPPRPAVTTPLPGFFLAGDWVDTGLPGTIESAVMSGHQAADAALRHLHGRARSAFARG